MEFSNILSSVVSRLGENAENGLSAILTAATTSSDHEDFIDNELQGLIEGVSEMDLSKCVAGAIKIFNNTNNKVVPDVVVASQAQQAAVLINGYCEIASEEMTPGDLVEKVVDMAECRLAAELDVAVDIGVEALPAIAAAIYPPLGPIAATVQPFVRQMAPTIKEGARKVLHTLSDCAKEVGKTVWGKLKEFVSDIIE